MTAFDYLQTWITENASWVDRSPEIAAAFSAFRWEEDDDQEFRSLPFVAATWRTPLQ